MYARGKWDFFVENFGLQRLQDDRSLNPFPGNPGLIVKESCSIQNSRTSVQDSETPAILLAKAGWRHLYNLQVPAKQAHFFGQFNKGLTLVLSHQNL